MNRPTSTINSLLPYEGYWIFYIYGVSAGTVNFILSHFVLSTMLRQKSFFSDASLIILNPTSPPKVEGFQYLGLPTGFEIKPLTLQGPPTFTIVSGVRDGLDLSTNRPGHNAKLQIINMKGFFFSQIIISFRRESFFKRHSYVRTYRCNIRLHQCPYRVLSIPQPTLSLRSYLQSS